MKSSLKLFVLIGLLLASLLPVENVLARGQHTELLQEQPESDCEEMQLIFIVDQSGSMSEITQGYPPSDPNGLRFSGPNEAVNTLSALRYQTYRTATIRVAMVYFGTQASAGMDWTELDVYSEAEHQQLKQNLALSFEPVEAQGDTNALGAFQFASSLFNRVPSPADGCPKRAVIVLTDGMPYVDIDGFDFGTHMAELQNYVEQYMSTPEHQIYVIGIDLQNRFWDRVKPYWEDVTGDPNKVVQAKDQAEMAGFIIRFAEEAARGLKRTSPGAIVECVSGGSLPIPPFVQQFKLTLIKPSPALHLELFDENGNEVQPNGTDIILEGFDEPIESLTIQNPQPGLWDLRTRLPANAKERCQAQLIYFKATGKNIFPNDQDKLAQFQRMPIVFKVVDSASDNPLPSYTNPKYALKTEASLVGPSKQEQQLSLTAKPDQQEYSGEIIPLEVGPSQLEVRAVTNNPDSSELVIFDEIAATVQVQPVQFTLIEKPSGPVEQYQEVILRFAPVTDGKTPLVLDLPIVASATVSYEGEASDLPLTLEDDGAYQAELLVEQAGTYVVDYQASVEAPPPYGKINLEAGQATFDIIPVFLIKAEFVKPTSDNFIATNYFFQPIGLDLQVQLVDENGDEVAPGAVGLANPTAPLELSLLDSDFNDLGLDVALNNTGKPGLFSLAPNTLGPGQYQIQVKPATTLGEGYAWADESWSKELNGSINPIAYSLVLAALVALIFLIWMIVHGVRIRSHPLSGYIRIYELKAPLAAVEDAAPYPYSVLEQDLPKRNKVIITPDSGLAGFLQRLPLIGRLIPVSGSIKRLIVTSPDKNYSDSGRARVTIEYSGDVPQTVDLEPGQEAVPLHMNYHIEKDPRPKRTYSMDDGLPEEHAPGQF